MMRRRGLGVALAAVIVSVVPAGAAMSTEERLKALENLVRHQQEEIKQLRGELSQQKVIGNATQQQAERAEEQAKTTEKKATASLPDWVNKFTPFGDIRIRHEGFYNQPTPKNGTGKGPAITARNRERVRYRLGLKYTYSDELSATVRLAGGDPNNPVSTNETLDGQFGRKHINLDWAFLTATPGKSFGIRPGLFSITAGKFPNPLFRADELVFDDDLSPEGFSETVQLLDHPWGSLDQVRLYAEQWTFKEVGNAQDGWMFGGQVNPLGHIGNIRLEAGLAQYSWLNPDFIAQAANTNSAIKGFTTNLVDLASDGKTITAFKSGFNESNLTLAATIPDVAGAMPLKIFGDYVYNWDAVNDDAHGLLAGLRLGQPKEAGDWAAALAYEYLEQEATIGTFTYDDFGNGGTNEMGPFVQLDYQLFNPLTLTARSFFTKYINEPAATNNRMQVRLQVEALLKF